MYVKKNIVALVPVKGNSERVKNLTKFSNSVNKIKLKQLNKPIVLRKSLYHQRIIIY